MEKLYDRQSFRAKWHDYNCGVYFITVCTKSKRSYFGHIKDAEMILSPIGRELDENIRSIGSHHRDVTLVNHVVMPNHFHLVVDIGENEIRPWSNERELYHNSRLAAVIGGIKSHLTKFCNRNSLPFGWQPKFHDRIIRGTREFHNIMDYVDNNPNRWNDDCFNND